MVRPECYQCARCGKSWSEFYPRVTCPCGCDVLRLPNADERKREPQTDDDMPAGFVRSLFTGDSPLAAIASTFLGTVLGHLVVRQLDRVDVALDDVDDAEAELPWSPYQSGNGQEGVCHG